MKRLPLYVVLGLLLVAVAVPMSGGELGFGGGPAPSATTSASAGPSTDVDTAASLPPRSATPSASAPSPTAVPSAPPVSAALADVLLVPVTQFRSTRTSTTRAEVAQVLAGTSTRYDAIELVAADASAILGAVGVKRPANPTRLVLAKDARTLTRHLAASRKRLAFLRADQIDASVRALAWGNASLFGVGRVRTVAGWPLTARLSVPTGTPAFDPAKTWTLLSGGDIMLDRGVAQTLTIRGKGADFPFDGGRAAITSRYCCSSFGWRLPRTQRTGGAGTVRRLMHGADLAIANFENPAPDKFRYHTSGTRFSADPRLIKGLATAGIDWVGLANNHIGDAGGAGLLQTIKNLRRYGIASSGAGKNIAAARKPAILKAGGVKVALLAYDTIAAYYTAGATRPGSARLTAKVVKTDVKAARAAGANVVIVFPHWGTEYDATPFPGQQALARAAVDAGADLVIGNHAHWAGAMEVYRGKPIWYALGNFVFDQTWSELTMEGITLELTFRGKTLVQARMRPHIILDKAQPNLLDPAADGRVVMGQIFDASKGLLPW